MERDDLVNYLRDNLKIKVKESYNSYSSSRYYEVKLLLRTDDNSDKTPYNNIGDLNKGWEVISSDSFEARR